MTAIKWSDESYEFFDGPALILPLIEKTKDTYTINGEPIIVDQDVTYEKFEQFEYYRDLYISNPKKYSLARNKSEKYIVTEAARGPKAYLRIVSHSWNFCLEKTVLRV